jgi:hypothetical protein
MEESPVSLIKKIKSDLLKDELLAKSNTEYKQINDKIINSKPYILNEIVEVNSTTTKVNDGKAILYTIQQSEVIEAENNSNLVLTNVINHKQSISDLDMDDNEQTLPDNFSKNVNVTNYQMTNDEDIYKFDSLDEARTFVKEQLRQNLNTWINTNEKEIDDICKKYLKR